MMDGLVSCIRSIMQDLPESAKALDPDFVGFYEGQMHMRICWLTNGSGRFAG